MAEYTSEQLNYFRACCVTTKIIPDGLREVFKQEWDARHISSLSKWNDTAQNGIDFSSIVTPRERTQNAKEIAIIRNGNTIEWDCTCFFYAILYSTCIGRSALRLHRTVKNSVHVLRIFRNEVAHNSKGEIADVNFKIAIQNVITAFTNLSLDVTAIEDIKNETSFPTDELYTIQKQLKKEKKRNEEPQSFWVLPPKPSHVTIARHSEVDMIWQEMDGLRCLHVDEVTHVYLSGNPGCGKSEVARQIGERFFSGTSGDSTKRFVATLNASSISTLLQSYVDFANQLKCDEDYIRNIVSSKDFTQEEKIRNLIRQVTPKTEKYHSWLMIVDNVVDLPAISNFFPHAGQKILIGSGQILITTQDSQSIPPASSNMHEESLSNGMQEDDAVTALFEISDQREDRASALQVAKALDFQPLALACAGVYISWVRLSLKRSMKWKEYLLKIPEGKRKSMERPFKKTSRSYPETMTTAVEMAVEKVMKEDKFMMFTFQFLSVIAPEPIPMEYVVRYVLKCMPDEDEDEDFVAAHIARSSLVLISEDETSESTQIRLHQIVHTVLVGTAKQVVEGDFLSLVNVTESFSSLNIKDDKEPDYQFITETQTLVPHFLIVTEIVHKQLKLIASSKTFCIDKALSMAKCLSCAVGTVCKAHGQLNAAKTCYELSLLIKESMCEKSGFDLISELNKLAEVLIDLQTYEEANKYLEQALADDELVRDENAPSYVRTLSNLGMVLAELGKYGEAEECLEKILAMKKCIDDDTLPFLGRILNCIGIMLSVLGRYEESKEFLEKAVDADQRTYGENHPYVSVRLSDLGLTMRELGQYREAKHYFERALTIHESIYGEDNKYLVIRLTNMGVVLKDIGHYQESKKYLERALAIDERTYDKLHPSLAVSLNNLGMILNDLGEYEEAKKYLERAHAIAKSKCKEDHPLFVASMNNVGLVLHGLGKYEEAKKTMESALAIVEGTSDENHPYLPRILTYLGMVLTDLRQYETANKHLKRALAITESLYNENHLSLTMTLNNLGVVLRYQGEYEEAKTYLERALAIEEHTFDENHPSLAKTLNNLAMVLKDVKQYDKAIECMERALAIEERTHDENHPSLAKTLNNLAMVLQDLEQHEEAKTYLKRALAIAKFRFDDTHPMVEEIVKNMEAGPYNGQ